MSFKTLFDKAVQVNSLSNKSANQIGGEIESPAYHTQDIIHEKRFIPNVDFSNPANFARYGSAEEYYIQSVERVYETFPYDGSLKERLEWENQSTYIDLHIYEHLYPRTNGYVIISADGWGTGTITDGYGSTSIPEYIYLKGGPHPNPNGMTPYGIEYTGSNYYDVETNRESNLKYDLPGNGVTVEFWLQKSEFLPSLTRREVIFDLWNGEPTSSTSYGRLTIELSASNDPSTLGVAPVLVTAQSGTAGFFRQSIGTTSVTTASIGDGNWHHYAISLLSSSGGTDAQFYVDGTKNNEITIGTGISEVTGALRAYIGALITNPSGSSATTGAGKLSGSLDEFRYWKTQRSAKDIGRYFISQVGGGTNTDPKPFSDSQEVVNTNLGVYYKFNEGITGIAATDSIVLDYSGRVTNGSWTGYTSNSRNTGSAIVISKAATKEYRDPIIRSNHPQVIALKADLAATGSAYDAGNNASIYNSIPTWIQESDSEGQKQVKYLTQIMASYFDSLQLQAEQLNELKNIDYVSGSDKPFPYSYKKLVSSGFVAPDIFIDADVLEKLADRSEDLIYDKSLNDIKNIIYQNIYNNLTYIYKSKGTVKSFRNLIRSFGIDDELIKLNMYAHNSEYQFRDNRRSVLINDKLVNFNNATNTQAVVYSFSSSVNPNSTGYIPAATQFTGGYAVTLESDITFPTKLIPGATAYFNTNTLSASLFGVHAARADQTDLTWDSDDATNFQVMAIRDELNSDNAYFMLTGTVGGYVPQLTSSLYEELYTDSVWNLSVRIKPERYPLAFFANSADTGDYTVVFSGVEVRSGEVVNTFTVSGNVSSPPDSFISGSRRVFLGAHRQNTTGTIQQTSDVKINSCRFWLDYVEDQALVQHALDTENYGALRPSIYAYPFDKDAQFGEVSKFDSLAFNWEFSENTGSNAAGEFSVADESSGSATLAATRFGWIGNVVNKQVTAQGYGFETSSASAIKKDFVVTARLNDLETIAPSETVRVLSAQDQKEFKIDSRPVNYFFSFEKSMSKVVTEEILNSFGTLKDFNNLVGDAVNRYRSEYKALEHIRQRFFENVANDELDFNRFYEFYKWFDSSLSYMLGQLVPASADFADNVRTIIESHALERSKYQTVFPFVDEESNVFEAQALSNVDYGDAISSPDDDLQGTGFYPAHAPRRRAVGLSTRELVKKWKYVHAPEDGDQTKNYLWWKDKAERNNPTIAEDTQVNNSRGSILSVIEQTTTREAERPYRFSIAGNQLLGGVGMHQNKDVNFAFQATQPYGPTMAGSNIPLNIMLSFDTEVETLLDTTDEFFPSYKQRLGFGLNPDINRSNDNRLKMNGQKLAPFSLYETTEQSTFNLQISSSYKPGVTITNLHHDFVGDMDIAAQGPFTEKFVGGRYYRHTELNDGNDTRDNRAEGFRLALGFNTSSSPFAPVGAKGALGIVPPNYPFASTPAGGAPLGWLVNIPTAQRFRPETAKRPVNIKNILMTTASIGTRLAGSPVHNSIGNYQKNYQVISTAARSVNDPYFQDQSFNFALNPETTATRGRFPLVVTSTENVGGTLNYELPDRSGANSNQTIMVNRFSSPGEYSVMSLGYMEPSHEELSVNNALPYRNRGVINYGLSGSASVDPVAATTITVVDQIDKNRGLDQRATLHCGPFGSDAAYGSVPSLTYVTLPSWHKTNRNVKNRLEEGGIVKHVYDNLYVQHAIPQSLQQYSWVTASLDSGSTIYGLTPPTCLSASVLNKLIISGSDISELTFVGLTTAVKDPLTASSHILGFPLSSVASSSYSNNDNWIPMVGSSPNNNAADYFNFLLTMRNGPWGYPTWRQIRVGETRVARKLRETNKIGLVLPPPEVPVTLTDGTTYQYVRGLSSNRFVDYIEQPISSRYSPTVVALEDNTEDSNPVNNITLKVSYGNDLDYFSHEPFNNRLNTPNPNLFDNSLNKIFSYVTSSRLSALIDYTERVYPAEINAYRNSTRRRTEFKIDNIWNTERDTRTSLGGLFPAYPANPERGMGFDNSQGILIVSQSIWPLDPHINFTTTASVLPLDFYTTGYIPTPNMTGATNGAGEFLNLYSRWGIPHPTKAGQSIKGAATYAARVPAGSASATLTDLIVYAGDALWEAGSQANKQPYEDYLNYSERIALVGKDYSIVPEFRISELMQTYVENKSGDFLADVDNIFNLTGAAIYDSSQTDFFKTYTNSDFLKYFTVVDDSLAEKRSGDLKIQRDKISLRCNALLKFLPYKGFYPAERTQELASLLSQSYGSYLQMSETFVTSDTSRPMVLRAFLEPLVAPGVLHNTIKSGLAVGNYVLVNTGSDSREVQQTRRVPAVTGSATELPEGTVQYGMMLNPRDNDPDIFENKAYLIQKIPFEAIQEPLLYFGGTVLTGSGAFYDTGVDQKHNALPNRANGVSVGTDGVKLNNGRVLYKLALDNFLCATTNFFTPGFANLQSVREDQFRSVTSGSQYMMKVYLQRTRDNANNADRNTFDLYGRESAFGYPLGQGLATSSNPTQKACFNHVVPSYYHGISSAEFTFTAPRTGQPTLEEIFANSTITYQTNYPVTDRLKALDMTIADSINLTDFFAQVPPGTVEQKRTWLIQSKFETPILNFANVSYTQPSGSHPATGLSSSADIKINGIWHQYGAQPQNSNEGVFLRIGRGTLPGTEPLADIVGFDTDSEQRVGALKEENLLEEAIVAIPYKTSENRRDFFKLDPANPHYDKLTPALKKYIFPPKFDFVTHNTVDPILMYVFEFSTAVTQTDITDMWQNLPPDIGEKFTQEEVVIEEKELVDSLYDQSDEIRWMIFKVKKRALKDFEIVRRRLVSDDVSPFKKRTGAYSYNWPYDYFSLVELVKVDETVRYTSGDTE